MKYKNTRDFEHGRQAKLGVLLVNLGTPEAPTRGALHKYLKQFLSDPRVVEVPRAIWFLVLNGIILPFRSSRSAKAYEGVWTQDGSPLLVNCNNIKNAVAQRFDSEQVEVELAMRYGNPSMDSQIQSLIDKGVTKLLVLPLYPQFSATTTASTFDALAASFTGRRWFPELRFVNQYHDEPAYIAALADKIRAHWEQHGKADKLIFSYHGIPKRYWDNGDPYACHCFKTSRLLMEALELEKDDVMTCFQSRFGKEEWLQPYLDKTLQGLPDKGVESVQVVCPGFSADCLETIEEIAEENRDYFLEAGGKRFEYIECLNDDKNHIDALNKIIDQHLQGWTITENPEITRNEFTARK